MFKLTKSRVLFLALFAVVGYLAYLFVYDYPSMAAVLPSAVEPMTSGDLGSGLAPASVTAPTTIEPPTSAALPATATASLPNGYKPLSTVSAADLLPLDANDRWSKENNLSGLKMPDLMSAEFMTGIDTIGQSLKHPNLQVRADPPIPRLSGNLWNNSDVDSDYVKAELDIGRSEGCRPY